MISAKGKGWFQLWQDRLTLEGESNDSMENVIWILKCYLLARKIQDYKDVLPDQQNLILAGKQLCKMDAPFMTAASRSQSAQVVWHFVRVPAAQTDHSFEVEPSKQLLWQGILEDHQRVP